MKIKKFRTKSMKDAISRIREELGPEAVILHSKRVSGPGKGGIEFEVTAAIEEHSSENALSDFVNETNRKSQSINDVFDGVPNLEGDWNERRSIDFLIGDDENEKEGHLPPAFSVKPKIRKRGTSGRTRRPESVPEVSMKLSKVHGSMLNNDVDEFVAESLVKTTMEETRFAGDGDIMGDHLPKSMKQFVKCSGPIQTSGPGPKIVAFVGPTGVGKTTTTAKLAINFALLEKKSIALVTVDIKRAAAVQQLKTYADMLQAPFEVALTPVELRRAIKKHADKDLILIDTAGRSPYKWISILELAGFFKGIDNLEVHLVLSLATNDKENISAVERFAALGTSRVLFTKADEVNNHGAILNVAFACNKPVSYITTGQNIPDDIEVAAHDRILELVSDKNIDRP